MSELGFKEQLDLFWEMFEKKEDLLEFLYEQRSLNKGSNKRCIQDMIDTVNSLSDTDLKQ